MHIPRGDLTPEPENEYLETAIRTVVEEEIEKAC